MKTIFNSTITTNSSRTEIVDGREYIVIKGVPIVGNAAMNGTLYPADLVNNRLNTLDYSLAPAGHPKVGGQEVSAYHPHAINVYSMGAYIKNSVMDEKTKKVSSEIWIDKEVATNSEKGKEVLEAIEKNKPIGLSIGALNLQTHAQSGKDNYGKEYQKVAVDFTFDHCALLLDEVPAGIHAGTVTVNNEKIPVNIVTNELSTREINQQIREFVYSLENGQNWTCLKDVYPESSYYIYEFSFNGSVNFYKQNYTIESDKVLLSGNPEEMEKTPSIELWRVKTNSQNQPTKDEGETMPNTTIDKSLIARAIVTCSSNTLTVNDLGRVEAMPEGEILNLIKADPTIEQAKTIVTNSGVDLQSYQEFENQKEIFLEFKNQQAKAKNELVQSIVTNSQMAPETLGKFTLSELQTMAPQFNTSIHTNNLAHGTPLDIKTNSQQSDDFDSIAFD